MNLSGGIWRGRADYLNLDGTPNGDYVEFPAIAFIPPIGGRFYAPDSEIKVYFVMDHGVSRSLKANWDAVVKGQDVTLTQTNPYGRRFIFSMVGCENLSEDVLEGSFKSMQFNRFNIQPTGKCTLRRQKIQVDQKSL